MAGTIKGIIVEIGGDTSGLQKALSKVNSSTSSLSKELRGINSLLKLDPKNTELLSQKQEVLAQNIQETSDKLKLLKQTQEKADDAIANGTEVSNENYRNLQREIVNTENKLKDLKVQASNWTKVGKSLEEVGNKITDISKKMDNMGSTLTTTLTLPVLAIGTAAVTTGNDFEAQMSRVQAIAGATGDQLKKLTQQAMDLGAETSFSASQVAEGMENLASAGFTTEEIMSAMPGLLDLAASSGADLATSSEIAASAIRGFGLEASSAGHVADVFAEAAARTNAQTQDMGEAMKYIAPVANTMGLKIEEVAAAIGIMSDAGIKGSQAGTSLRGALTRLTKPTDKMLGVMDDLGISFYDNEGKMKSLTEMISMLQDATRDLTDEQTQNALTVLFGTESLSGMVSLINRGSDDLSDLTKSFEKCDGSASDMADTMLDNTSGALESLSGSLETAGIVIQKALAPEIKKLAKWIQGLVDDFSDLSDEQQLNILKIVGLVAAIGPAIKIISKLSGGIGTAAKGLGTFAQAIAVATNKTTSNVKSVNNLSNAIKSLTSPVGLATTAIGLTAGAILYMNEKAKEIPETLQTAINEMKDYKEEHKSFREEIDKTSASNMAEIANIEELKDELSTLVDENGRVKESYKDRVNFILKELNEALGTEYSMTGNIIEQYKTLQDEIETLILKKKAQIILENEEAKYSEAIANKEEAYQKMINAQNEYNEALEGKTYEQYFEELKQNYIDAGYTAEKSAEHAKSYMAKWVDGYKQNYEDARQIHNDYLNDIAAYENDYAIIQSENNEKIQELIKRRSFSYEQSSADIGETINHNIQQVQYEMQQYKNAYNQDLKYQDEYNAKKNKAQIDAGQKHLETLTQQLIESTSTVKEMTPQQVEAWKNLAQNSFDIYKKYVNNMEPEMQEEIQEVTGVLINNTSVTDAATNLASNAKNAFNKNLDGRASGENFVEGVRIGMNARSAALVATSWALGKKTLSSFNDSLDEHSPSELSKESGVNFVQGVIDGIILKRIEALNLIEKLGKDLIKKFSLNYDKNMLNYNAPDASFFNKTIESSKTIFTTPTLNIYTQDELTPTKINSIIDAVNRRLGSKY